MNEIEFAEGEFYGEVDSVVVWEVGWKGFAMVDQGGCCLAVAGWFVSEGGQGC